MARDRDPRLRGLYAITPETTDTARLLRDVAAVVEGGATIVQYRRKGGDAALVLAQARDLREACRRAGALFIVNDSVDLALAVDADGAHLGRDDGDLSRARALLGDRILGVSCYADPESAARAAQCGADYVALGSAFSSRTKPAAVALPLSALGEARALSRLPVAAIGGITPENAPLALAAGADMLAVITALFDAPDPNAAARCFCRLFVSHFPATRHVRTQPQAL